MKLYPNDTDIRDDDFNQNQTTAFSVAIAATNSTTMSTVPRHVAAATTSTTTTSTFISPTIDFDKSNTNPIF